MPTINKRFLIRLVLAVLVLAGALVGLHTIQAARIPDALQRQAERAVAANKPDAAIRYYRQYLEFCPRDADAQEQLAELIRKRSRADARSELIFLYDKILRTDPMRENIRREAVITSLQLGRFSDAATHAELLLKAHPDESAVWRQLARAQVQQRKFEDAQQSFSSAIQFAPNEPRSYQEYAEFLWLDRESPSEAKLVYDRMVAALPQHPDAYLARARFLIATAEKNATLPAAKDDPVLADLNRALELSPNNVEASVLKGERLQRHRDVLAARDAFLTGLKHHPDDERLIRSLAWLEVNRGNHHGAIQVLEDAVERAKDGTDILVPLADLLLQNGESDKTREIIQKLEKRRGKNVKLRAEYLRGRLAMHEQKWDAAIAAFVELRSASVELPALETQANLLLANCYQQLGESSKAIESFKLVTMKEPGNANARLSLVYALLNAGNATEAARELDTAASHPSATPKLLSLGIQFKALRQMALGTTPEQAKELEQQALATANRLGTKTADGVLLLADYAIAVNRSHAAVAMLQKELPRFAQDSRVWLKLVEAVADTSGVAQALKLLDDARGPLGDGAELRLARAALYARDPAQLREISNLETLTESWPEEEQARLLYGLIDIADQLGDAQNVLRLYKKIAARRPRDRAVWLALCERAWKAGDRATATEAERAIGQLEPKSSDDIALCSAWKILATGGNPNEVVALLGERPTRANACIALARSLQLSKQKTDAANMYIRAVQLEPMRFEPATAYLTHLITEGSEQAVKRYLLQLGTDPRWAGEPFRRVIRATAISFKDSQPSANRLIVEARTFMERQSGGLGRLADLYAALGRTNEAMKLCEQIVRLPNSTPDDWLRLAIRSAEILGRDAGVAVVLSAKPKLSSSAFSNLAAAFVESRVGRGAIIATSTPVETRALAESQLTILLAQLKRTEAIRHLETYLERKPSERDVAWARRNLAMLLTVRGEPADRKRAYDLMLIKQELSHDDRRATVSVLSSLYRYMDGTERENVLARAVEILEEMTKDAKPNANDRFQLSQLYQAQQRTSEAVGIVQQLLNDSPEKVEYLLAAMGILDEANRLEAVQPFAERLLAVAPYDYRTIAAVARWECKRGRIESVLRLIEKYERTADASAGEQTHKTARSAELLQELARMPTVNKSSVGHQLADLAVARYESILHARPDLLPALATTLAADGRIGDAMQKLEKQGKNLAPQLRALGGVAAFRVGGVAEPHRSTVASWLATAIAREPSSIPLQLAQAEFWTMTQQFPAAERTYRQVLETDPRNLVALNNLAWLLAPNPGATGQAEKLLERAALETGLTGELLDTRARIRISAKQFDLAEQDATEALKQNKTPLRYFHLALAQRNGAPTKSQQSYELAKQTGLNETTVHPQDVAILRSWQ